MPNFIFTRVLFGCTLALFIVVFMYNRKFISTESRNISTIVPTRLPTMYVCTWGENVGKIHTSGGFRNSVMILRSEES